MERNFAKVLLVLLVIGLVLVSGCTGKFAGKDSTTGSLLGSKSSAKEFTIHDSNFKFEPSVITVNQGDTVRLTEEVDQGFHNIVVEGYDVKTVPRSSPKTQTVEFVADKAGTFPFYCGVSGHRSLGMEGKLIVK